VLTIQPFCFHLYLCVGDLVIGMSCVQLEDPVPKDWQPIVVMVDQPNAITTILALPVEGRPYASATQVLLSRLCAGMCQRPPQP
jgi:hypothetical protein